MLSRSSKRCFAAAACLILAAAFAAGQTGKANNKPRAQEVDEKTGIPVLMEHLPGYDRTTAARATFAKDVTALKAALGDRPELDLIDFSAGTEAVTAPYDAGKLLIIEYPSPQQSVEADSKFRQAVAPNSSIDYRRIGNYNVLVFDVTDKAAAEALLDQVHYQKQVQWLGEAPPRKAGVTVPQMAGVLISSLLLLVAGGGLALVGGGLAGYVYYLVMIRRRATMTTFTDAGGLTRLNLDGLTPEILPKRLLGE